MEIIFYIILGIVALGLLKALFRSKLADVLNTKDRYDQAMNAANRSLAGGHYHLPSWDRDDQRVGAVRNAIKSELGKTFDVFDGNLKGNHLLRAALTAAYHMEKKGFGFFEQVTGAVDFVKSLRDRGLLQKLEVALANGASESNKEDELQKDGPFIEIAGLEISTAVAGLDLETVVSRQLMPEIVKRCPTELDLYRYLVEEADWLSENEKDAVSLEFSEIHELEYEGESAKARQYARNRKALEWLDSRVTPDLTKHFGQVMADKIRGAVFVEMNLDYYEQILALRLKYAVHYHNNCVKQGSYGYADRWDEIIKDIEGRLTASAA